MSCNAAEKPKNIDIISNQKERIYWLDNTKFFLITLVVVGHFISVFRKYDSINYLYYFIFMFHMPLFIFIMGFFSKNAIKKGKNKILNYILLYIVMQTIEIIINKEEFTIVKPAYALWYLQAIIIYNLLLPIINKMKPIIACTIAVAVGILIGFDNNANTIESISTVFVMLPFFIIGYFTSENTLNKLISKKAKIFAIVFLILIAMLIPFLVNAPVKIPKEFLWATSSYKKMKIGNIGVLYRAIWYILATFTSLSVMSIIPKKKLKLISKFGTRTLQVYCLHIIAILEFKKTGLYKIIDTKLEVICLIIGAIALTFILSLKIFSYPFDFIMSRKFKIINKKEMNDGNI